MPVKLEKGILTNYLDIDDEIYRPHKNGRYLEVVAKIDAYIDNMLNSLLRQIYSDNQSQSLLNFVEKAMKKDYLFVSGLVKLRILEEISKSPLNITELKTPKKEIRLKIRRFKEERNKVLHSELGHYNLIKNHKQSNEKFQLEARKKIDETIKLGIRCYVELKNILLQNARDLKDV